VVSSIAAIWERWPDVVELCLAGEETAALDAAELAHTAGGVELSYRSSKAALLTWMRRAAPSAAWGGSGILLNAVAPGTIETAMNVDLWSTAGARAETLKKVPTALGRLGRPSEVAEVLSFLTSPANSYLVGQVLFVDGGTEALSRGESAW
jgi:NAD(P)-dependent dehydrogenase (short-subunit alcohol dehydrogenase family)